MKRLIALFLFLGVFLYTEKPIYGVHNLIFKSADDLTSGTLPNARLDPSSVTLRGTQWSYAIDAATTAAVGSVSGLIAYSTFSIDLVYGGSVNLSTIGVIGVPGAYFNNLGSTLNVVAYEAYLIKPSTVGWTRLQLSISTGGVGALPVLTNRFLPLDITTASSLGVGAYSGFVSSSLPVFPFETVGVQVGTCPVSGQMPVGINVRIWAWRKSFGQGN